MAEIQINAFDGVAVVVVLLGARAGFIRGFADVFWVMLRWGAMLAAGVSAWSPFGRQLSALTGLSALPSAEFAYLVMAGTAALAVAGLNRLLGEQMLLAIPPNRADCVFGAVAGGVGAAAAILNVYAILNPFAMTNIEWNPGATGGYDTAIQDLVAAVLATLRNAALEGSWIGRAVQEHLGMLLIRPAA
jgi:hypothetical protein